MHSAFLFAICLICRFLCATVLYFPDMAVYHFGGRIDDRLVPNPRVHTIADFSALQYIHDIEENVFQ